jgi:nicotinamide-nucleotide amidase
MENGKTLATAESCTGGYLAHLITSIAGSSAYFKGSIVSYSNAIKERILNVKESDLKKHGAVSQPVVETMATQVRELMKTDLALATSGVAGPAGGGEEKPIGTVWIALSTTEGVYSKKFLFEKDRNRNIQRSAYAAISMVLRYLRGNLKVGLQ